MSEHCSISASYLTSAVEFNQCPDDDVPEIAFVGRSNAGKSSSLNRLTHSRQLARVSKTPGRTQQLNFFEVETGGRLVDLPGYGYAKAGRERQREWQRAVDDYLQQRLNLTGLVLVMDARHSLRDFDRQMINWSVGRGLPLMVLLNKADKLNQSQRSTTLRAVREYVASYPHVTVTLFSAHSGWQEQVVCDWVRQRLQT